MMMTSMRFLLSARKVPAVLRSSVPLALSLFLLLFASLGAFAQTDGNPPPKYDPYAEPVPTTTGGPVLPDADNPADPAGTPVPAAPDKPSPLPPAVSFVTTSGGHFAVDGHSFRHVGVNEIDYVYEGNPNTDQWNDTYFHRQGGIKQIRVILANTAYNLPDTISHLEEALGAAWSRGIRLTVAFNDFYWSGHYGHRGNGGFKAVPGDEHYYDQPCGQYCPGVYVLDAAWFQGGYTVNYKPFVQAVVDHFRGDGRIFAWEIGNELKGDTVEGSIAFYRDMAQTIKAIDHNHLVSPGIICTTWLGMTSQNQKDRLYQYLDYVTEHHYINHPNAGDLSDDQLALAYNKPLVIEEFGANQHLAPYATDHDRILPDVVDFFDWAYDREPVKQADAVMVWGVDFSFDRGSGDADHGPSEQGLGNEYLQLWRENADWSRLSPRYSDVPPGDTFYSYIECLSSHRAVNGHFDWVNDDHNDEFHPGGTVTRGDAIKALVRAMGLPFVVPASGSTFTDVPRSSPYFRYVETAVANRIISGYSDRTFRPDNPLTRGQMCKVIVIGGMVKYGWQINLNGGPHFTDVPTNQTFYAYIETAYNRQIVSGYGSYFLPDNLTTRGQFAKMLSQAISCH